MLKSTPIIYHAAPELSTWWNSWKIVNATLKNTREIMKTGVTYLLPLEKRKFSVWEDGFIYIGTSGNKKPRQIDHSKDHEKPWNNAKNSLRRELTVLIKGVKDAHLASDQMIGEIAKLLLRIAWDKEKRAVLKSIGLEYPDIVNMKHRAQDITPEIETRCKSCYESCINWLNFTEEEKEIINYFSWEWKSTFRHCPYSCKVWMILVCIYKMINLDKE